MGEVWSLICGDGKKQLAPYIKRNKDNFAFKSNFNRERQALIIFVWQILANNDIKDPIMRFKNKLLRKVAQQKGRLTKN